MGEPCYKCMGEGGWHDCGEDCCCCLDPEEITHVCDECHGTGKLGSEGDVEDYP